MHVFSLAGYLHKTAEEIMDTMGAVEMRKWSEYFKQCNEEPEPDWSDPDTVKEAFNLG